MTAILFICENNWGKEYKYVILCETSKVNAVIEAEKKLSTEIIDTELLEGFLK